MSAKHCEDCGTKLRSGICTNCHEELYINDFEMPSAEPAIPVSGEWRETVERQREELKERKRRSLP